MKIEKINPQITQKFLKAIRGQKLVLKIVDGVKIRTCPGVFPPQSDFSRSSKKLHNILWNLKNKTILDIGTGTGIQAIHAARVGAKKIIATDISSKAVDCARYNVELNGFGDKISVIKSDLFAKVPKIKFDVVIANLPIVDYPEKNIVGLALYDNRFKIHKRFFYQVKKFLKRNGYMIFSHANLQSDRDFDIIENLVSKEGLKIDRTIIKKDLGYVWKMYRVKV